MPARVRAFCAHTGQPEPADARRGRALHPREPRAQARETVDLLAVGHRRRAARDPRRRRRRAQRAALPLDRERRRACRSLAGPEEATLVGNLLVQAMALGEIASLAEAREVVRASFAPTVYEPQDDGRLAGGTRALRRDGRARRRWRCARERGHGRAARHPGAGGPLGRRGRGGLGVARRARLPLEPARRRPRAREPGRRQHLREGDGRRPRRPRAARPLGEGLGHRPRDDHGRRDSPALRLDEILPLREREAMDDATMVEYLLRCALAPDQPRPSIETLLHAFVPAAHVDHTHPDAIIALTSTPDGRRLAEETFGDEAVWLDYQRPGFDMSKRIAELLDANPAARAVLLETARPRHLGRDAARRATATRSSSSRGPPRRSTARRSGRFGLGGQQGRGARGRRAARPPRAGAARAPRRAPRRRRRRRARGRPQPGGGRVRLVRRARPR